MKISTKEYLDLRQAIIANQKKWIAKWYPNSHNSKLTRKDIAKRFNCSIAQLDKLIKQCKDEGLI